MEQSSKNKKLQVTTRTQKRPVQRQQHRSTPSSPQTILQRAQGDPQNLSQNDVLQLQRTIGNQATMNFLQGEGNIQRRTWFERFFGKAKPRTRIQATPTKTHTSTSAENQEIMAHYRRRLRTEKKAVKSFTYLHHRDGTSLEKEKRGRVALEMFKNPIAWALFRNHCHKEFSGENPGFLDFVLDQGRLNTSRKDKQLAAENLMADQNWTAPQGWNQEKEATLVIRDLTVRQALAIYHTYIENGKAKYEINVSSLTRNSIKTQVDRLKDSITQSRNTETPVSGNDPAPRTLIYKINTAAKEIISLCNDSMVRFKKTPEYDLARLALKNNASLDIYANQYAPYMDYYQTEQDRRDNTVGKHNTPWWKR